MHGVVRSAGRLGSTARYRSAAHDSIPVRRASGSAIPAQWLSRPRLPSRPRSARVRSRRAAARRLRARSRVDGTSSRDGRTTRSRALLDLAARHRRDRGRGLVAVTAVGPLARRANRDDGDQLRRGIGDRRGRSSFTQRACRRSDLARRPWRPAAYAALSLHGHRAGWQHPTTARLRRGDHPARRCPSARAAGASTGPSEGHPDVSRCVAARSRRQGPIGCRVRARKGTRRRASRTVTHADAVRQRS